MLGLILSSLAAVARHRLVPPEKVLTSAGS
jgi:hypothetical protein